MRIDEVKLGLPNIDDISNAEELSNDIAKLREELKAKQEELAQAKAGGQVAEKTKELRMIEGQMLDLKNKYRQTMNEKIAGKSNELIKIQNEINKLKVENDARSRAISFSESEIKSLDEKLNMLRQKWHKLNAEHFEYEQSETCPTCGQPIPQEKLQDARDKALADFNRAKAENLESVSAEGKRIAALKAPLEEAISQNKAALEDEKKELAELEQKEAALKEDIDAIMRGAEPVETTPEYVRLQKQHEELQEQIRQAQANVSTTVAAIQKEADEISGAIQALEQAQARFDARESGLRRIEELKAEERKLAAEYEELERQIYLTEEFIRAKVQMLEDKINSKFKMARFKLFETQVNGAVAECCETTFNGVPYSNLNNGAKVQVGLDIIRTLQAHYGFSCPVWIDNRESIVRLPEMECQVISLIVSERDKKLRIELAEKNEMKEVV